MKKKGGIIGNYDKRGNEQILYFFVSGPRGEWQGDATVRYK
jgi:hypothetical protein